MVVCAGVGVDAGVGVGVGAGVDIAPMVMRADRSKLPTSDMAATAN